MCLPRRLHHYLRNPTFLIGFGFILFSLWTAVQYFLVLRSANETRIQNAPELNQARINFDFALERHLSDALFQLKFEPTSNQRNQSLLNYDEEQRRLAIQGPLQNLTSLALLWRTHANLWADAEQVGENRLNSTSRKRLLRACRLIFYGLPCDRVMMKPAVSEKVPGKQATIPNLQRAIVICVYDKVINLAMTTIINIRRHLESEIPIFISYLDDGDLSASNRDHMLNKLKKHESDHSVYFMELKGLLDAAFVPRLNIETFAMKPLSLLLAPCVECILMDADAFMLQIPNHFFQIAEYKRTGALFFHDRTLPSRNMVAARAWFLSFLPDANHLSRNLRESQYIKGYFGHEQESGLILIDKKPARNRVALLIASALNTGPLRDKTWSLVYGDKETYWMSMEVAQASYAWNGKYPGNLGQHVRFSWWWQSVCGGTMVHVVASDPEKLLWFNGGLTRNKYLTETNTKDPNSNDAVFDSWTIGGGWDIEKSSYCMRSLFGGWLSSFEATGTPIRSLQMREKLLLQKLLHTFHDVAV